MANFHPNLTSRSRENVYIKKLSLKFWRTTQKKSGKLRKNAESLPFIKSNVFTAFQIISSSGTLTKKILNLNLHTDGQEEQVKYHWPLESTQISTFSRRKLRYCATPNPQLLRCTAGFQWAKCSPVCPFENDNCCMACLLSKQEDFTNQISMLETVIQEAGHKCIFLPKFHCELNPIEMVSSLYLLRHSLIYYILSLSTVLSIGDGLLEIQTVGYIFPFVLIA